MNRYIARDYEGALESARSAKKFAIGALVGAFFLYVLALLPTIIILATAQ